MENSNKPSTRIIPWTLFVITLLVPFYFWGNNLDWDFSSLTAYLIFPLLGIWAWGLMWTHYAYGALRLTYPEKYSKNKLYSKVTAVLVLLMILLHPALLAMEQKKNTGELPPQSFYDYVASNQQAFIAFGSIALIIFLSFEIFNRIKNKPLILKNWRIISLSQMLAMVLIFFHGFALGNNLESFGLELYWVILGALLIPCFAIIGRDDWSKK